jgi:hypothetical protein
MCKEFNVEEKCDWRFTGEQERFQQCSVICPARNSKMVGESDFSCCGDREGLQLSEDEVGVH